MFFLGIGLAYILTIGSGLLALGLAGHAVWRAVMPPVGLSAGATCGSCGYEITTFEGGRCSECGADLLKSGILTRRNAVRLAGSLPAALIGWTIIVVSIGSISVGIASMVTAMNSIGTTMNISSSNSFGPMATFDEDAGSFVTSADYDITIDCDVVGGFGSPATSGEIVATLVNGDETIIITMDAVTGAWSMAGPDGVEIDAGSSFDTKHAAAAYAAVGLDTASSEALDNEAEDFVQLVGGALQDPWNYTAFSQMNMNINMNPGGPPPVGGLTSTGSTIGNSVFTPPAIIDMIVPIVISAIALLIWVAGIILITRRRAGIIRGPRPQAA